MTEQQSPISQTGPLHAAHSREGAKFADFGGWLMPLEFVGGGVLAEHAAVRQTVGAFDVSHMGTLEIAGPGALAALNAILTNDLTRIEPGQAQYSLLCDETGGVVDDLLVYVRSADELLMVPNAANTAAVRQALQQGIAADAGIVVRDISESIAILAIQGPAAEQVIAALGLPTELAYMSFVDVQTPSGRITLARSGYTGERGYELLIPTDSAADWWQRIVDLCRDLDGRPCGLGARDTLRTEMGYPLHGHELGPDITPVQAGLSWAVGWDKPAFSGRTALIAERESGPSRRLRGLRCTGRGIPRPDMTVRSISADHADIGVVTSGTFSPTARQGVALALLDSRVQIGDLVEIDVRGRPCQAEVVKPPFVSADPR